MSNLIMTVDDSSTVRRMVAAALTGAGYEVIQAANGADALAKLTGLAVRLVITDMNMPIMEGLELIHRLRALPEHKFTPIVFLSAESQPEKQQEGKAAGATAWIEKPFTPEDLIAVIKKVVR
jgi:two-component system, chemotaxis family, chemotaxis protein CheY